MYDPQTYQQQQINIASGGVITNGYQEGTLSEGIPGFTIVNPNTFYFGGNSISLQSRL